MDFEKNFQKLKLLVDRLEGENLGIEDSLKLYDEAIKLGKSCIDSLKESKGKLELLNKDLSKISLDPEEE
ncbi:MAG TPA: exodeoxyribonuclease VII small subunit [Candidatus Stercoripulliclostridium merdigallinarum]|uniref:Exodeoxyribonuclease 7 small subunit n=1 Tax=Candidatus Stercoripulliclostridium merdigallinarum TaxID=2840951 RepID=A0A9D1MHI3_9FIRM|nr:exodeoxyribonuclease VII small subunit [Candidatus Stercoripulliclostridium merdigallinarum]